MKSNDDDDDGGSETTFIAKGLSKWDFDIFRLQSTVLPLTKVTMSVFYKYNLIPLLGLDENVCINFFMAIEHKYKPYPQLTYHTSLHAADVVHSMYNLMEETQRLGFTTTPLKIFSALVAAAIHDVGHPGLTNPFLCAIHHPLAILYNDTSVLENHHAATAFTIAQQPECNIFAPLAPDDQTAARKQIIHMVLHTDMNKHSKLLADCRGSSVAQIDSDVLFAFLIHAADLSSMSKAWPLCKTWASHIMTELFAQGDQEAALGLPIGYDRRQTTLAKSQLAFIDLIGRPLWATWDALIGVAQSPQSLAVEENRRVWGKI